LSSKIVEGKLHALLDAILNDLRNIINVLATDCQQDQRALILFRGLQSLTVGRGAAKSLVTVLRTPDRKRNAKWYMHRHLLMPLV